MGSSFTAVKIEMRKGGVWLKTEHTGHTAVCPVCI
jgi:hypothetical protein